MLQIWASMGKHGYGQARCLELRQTRQARISGSMVAGLPALKAGLGWGQFKVSLGHRRSALKRKKEKENK